MTLTVGLRGLLDMMISIMTAKLMHKTEVGNKDNAVVPRALFSEKISNVFPISQFIHPDSFLAHNAMSHLLLAILS